MCKTSDLLTILALGMLAGLLLPNHPVPAPSKSPVRCCPTSELSSHA